MNWMLICVLIAFAIYLFYNAIALRLFGVPESLSQTYYLFKEKKNWYGIFFPLMMITMALVLLPAWLEITEGESLQFLAFLAAAGIIFTGSAPAFQSGQLDNVVHMSSAICAAICSLLWVVIVAQLWYVILVWLLVVLFFAVYTKTLKTSIVYWLETIAFLSTFVAVIAYLI